MANRNINKNELHSLRQYRNFAYWSAILSFILLIVIVILKTLSQTVKLIMFSTSVDTVIYETMIVACGSFLATALIGIIYERFQTKIINDVSVIRDRFIDEGILKVYKSSTDSKLLEFMQDEIINSKNEIIAVGLGLGILSHNYQLLEAIADKVNKIDHYRLKIFLGSANNNGVKNRIHEEKLIHDKNNLNYDESWIQRYPSEINGVLRKLIDDKMESKFSIKEIDTCPMVSVIKIDNTYLFFPYGTPNIKGSHSPWMVIDGYAENSAMVKFLKGVIKFYQ